MHRLSFLAFFLLLLNDGFSQVNKTAKMFRDNVTHSSYVSTPGNIVYDTKAWQFSAESPVRSTPLINNNTIYFGTAKGDFFAIDKKTSKVKWRYNTGKAIHSSAACYNGKLYFSDNGQTLYCLQEANGQLAWKLKLGDKLDYPWRFDYYYSSPVLFENKLYIGSDDGHLYAVNIADGKTLWKFRTPGLVRSTPGISNNTILFGDTEGNFYCLDLKGNVKWTYKVIGEPLKLDTLGFDRKAILGASVITGGKVIFGARDGYLYCLDINDGKQLWTVDHDVSWIISTVAVKDTFVITGTSDGRFVQAVNLNTGKQIWKYRTPLATWSSPLIHNDKVYEGCYDGQLFCLDLATGKRISQFATNGIIYSSAVIDDGILYIGSDDGNLYALKGHPPAPQVQNRLVYYDPQQVKIYFRNGADTRVRNYLAGMGFKSISTDTLAQVLSGTADNTVIVFATDYFPKETIKDGNQSLIRKFLDRGGRIVLVGNNPLFFDVDEKAKQIQGLNNRLIDSVLSLDYGPTDTRAFGGLFPGFTNEKGKYYGLPDFWVSNFGIDKKQVDIVLGENENGQASAFVKNYNNGGRFVQVYVHPEIPVNLDGVIKVAEWRLE